MAVWKYKLIFKNLPYKTLLHSSLIRKQSINESGNAWTETVGYDVFSWWYYIDTIYIFGDRKNIIIFHLKFYLIKFLI